MRIGIDATCWANRRGYGRFTRALLTALLDLDHDNHYIFFVDHESEEFPLPSSVEICRVVTKVPTLQAAGADTRRSLSDLLAVARVMRRAPVDLIYFPSEFSYVPLFTHIPQIVTLHDATSELFPELVFPSFRARFFFGVKKRMAIHQARLLVTVSDYSRRCLEQQLGIPAARFRIVGEAADPVFRPLQSPTQSKVLARWGIPPDAPCVIFVGGFSPHKNLQMLLDLFLELLGRNGLHNMRLVLVGDNATDPFHSCYGQLLERSKQPQLEGRVLFTGHLSDQDLVILLNRSDVLVLPSFTEGFGLPGVEAAACGTPVLATTESPLPGLLGDGALGIQPGDRSGWIRALENLVTDRTLRTRMSEAALAAASQLTWRNSARQLLSVFEEVHKSDHAPA
jgi:glycosyltransferase involved in cell wall biosynthesis